MTDTAFAVTARRLFDGETFVDNAAIVVDGGHIARIVPEADLPGRMPIAAHGGSLLAPGFIDLQVNGGGGVLFNEATNLSTLVRMAAAHARFGTVGLLPTLITDTNEKMFAALAAVAAALEAGVPGILGIHLEGPYLSPHRPGIHDPALIRPPGPELDALSARFPPVTLVTLAPECVDPRALAKILAAGARVAAGHTDATFAEASAAFAAGVSGVTHLFNAMSQLTAREPGMVGAALAAPDVWCGIIADGWHVHPEVLRSAIRAKRAGTVLLVTDAMAECGADNGSFRFRGIDISIKSGRCSAANGTLAGSALDMASAVRNVVVQLGQPLGEALRMAALYPARAMGLDARLGRIAPGYRASFVALNESLHINQTWIGGKAQIQRGTASSR